MTIADVVTNNTQVLCSVDAKGAHSVPRQYLLNSLLQSKLVVTVYVSQQDHCADLSLPPVLESSVYLNETATKQSVCSVHYSK